MVRIRSLKTGLTAAILLVAGMAAAAPDFAAMSIQPYQPPKPAPAFSLPDLEGKPRQLAELQGKVVMMFFWATW
jgi:cytochrome oxidase Cu insertion factor (SCO1/SenC/PrrC family)